MTNIPFKHITILLVSLCLINQINTTVIPDNGVSCCDDNTININGFGKVFVQPDISIVSIGISVTAKTSQ